MCCLVYIFNVVCVFVLERIDIVDANNYTSYFLLCIQVLYRSSIKNYQQLYSWFTTYELKKAIQFVRNNILWISRFRLRCCCCHLSERHYWWRPVAANYFLVYIKRWDYWMIMSIPNTYTNMSDLCTILNNSRSLENKTHPTNSDTNMSTHEIVVKISFNNIRVVGHRKAKHTRCGKHTRFWNVKGLEAHGC